MQYPISIFLIYCRDEGADFEVASPADEIQLDWWIASINQNGWFDMHEGNYARDSGFYEVTRTPVYQFWVTRGDRVLPKKGMAAKKLAAARNSALNH